MDPTQISLGGFGKGVTARELTEYLETRVGTVWRCRLKTSWTPPNSYPKFTTSNDTMDYTISTVPPHAFVQFAIPAAVKEACRLAEHLELRFNGHPLKVKVGVESSSRIYRRKEIPPLRFPLVSVEIGSLISPFEFWVGWRAPTSGVEFHVDPFDRRCRILFTRDTLFHLPEVQKDTVIKCDFKIEFLVRDIRSVGFSKERGTLVMLLQLWVPPWIYYRTADDDIYTGVPFNLLDDEDPWIRTVDFTPNNAVGRCLAYKISVSPRMGYTMEKARDYFQQHHLIDEKTFSSLKVQDEVWVDDYTIEVRRMVITPTKAYCLPSEVELSNRVIRHFRRVADRFLRVAFMDDSMEAMSSIVLTVPTAPIVREVYSSATSYRTAIFKRVKNILHNGFELCGRNYSFLAFSANQLRDRSAWFFAGGESIHVQDIRDWMGKFPKFNVAKCAARMGQCFSSTYCTVEVPLSEVERKLPDIERNGYNFSDGIGKITPDLAMEVARRLQLVDRPSAYQIRFGGYKGVVTTWAAKPRSKFKLSLRPSMLKFESQHNMLEVISWTRFLPCFLNRQIITLLSALKVPGSFFRELQDSMVYNLSQMLENLEVAFNILATSCTGDVQNTAGIMLSAGFEP
eukprot:Gb_08298 [translate_table: standard]